MRMSFCFFKQKTAYDMRISDWSSDVCSSDLLDQAQVVHQRVDAQFLQRLEVQLDDVVGRGLHHHLVLVVALQAVGVLAVAAVGGAAAGLPVGGVPRLRAERAQAGGRGEGSGADCRVEKTAGRSVGDEGYSDV